MAIWERKTIYIELRDRSLTAHLRVYRRGADKPISYRIIDPDTSEATRAKNAEELI